MSPVITATHTQLQLLTALDIPSSERAEQVRRSMLDQGYSVAAPRPYETAQGRRYRVDGVRTDQEEVVL